MLHNRITFSSEIIKRQTKEELFHLINWKGQETLKLLSLNLELIFHFFLDCILKNVQQFLNLLRQIVHFVEIIRAQLLVKEINIILSISLALFRCTVQLSAYPGWISLLIFKWIIFHLEYVGIIILILLFLTILTFVNLIANILDFVEAI